MTRYCTVEMKLKPIFNWLKENIFISAGKCLAIYADVLPPEILFTVFIS